ncbi:MMPL family transporter [Mycobacteroides abscessus]|uniref:MMPL family transporter n=1 Tax=Mycobacteroides abscessus TaxID=36809 RepID=UPI0009CBDEF3|nr:MMPL family transporter [Mycobacteroides abscessus]SKM19708.1 putative membrane transport protein [Mycobacteroides abscessus subsp. massiliense]SLD62291.1 putative membrane transport protein [Mycobacteroides abscessus subsp. massiliense]SLD89354.1 putative membrane transport protein [Mycobacteroides abscessus subsp. massiliense]
MSSFLYQLGRAVARRRLTVLAVWIIALALAGGGATFNTGTNDTFEIPGTQSQDALDYLGRVFPEISGTSVQLVIVMPSRSDVRALATTPTAQMMAEIKNVDQVASVINPFDPNPLGPPPPGTKPRIQSAISADGRAAIITVQLEVALADVNPATRTQLTEIGQRLAEAIGHGATVNVGGPAFSNPVPKLSPTATAITPVSSTAPMLAVMLGLAVGIDYALFLISRHRDQLAEGLEVEESIARATATAGSAVIFAGLTVIIALLGLAVAAIPFLTTMGLAAATAVAVAVAVAITLVPALMAFCGQRLRPKPVRSTTKRPPRKGLGHLWVRTATRMPLLTVVVVVAALALCTIPATQLRLSLPDNGTEEPGSPARDTYDVVTEHFGPGYNGPLIVTADIITSTDPVAVMNSIAEEISRMPGVASVPIATPNPKADTGIVQVVPAASPDSPQTEELATAIGALRSHFKTVYGTDTAVTGITAVGIDVSAQLGASLLPFGILVVGLSLVLLAMVFRSIWVPIKATAGYLLSVSAAFGATSLVFQQGHLADLLHVTHTGSVVSFLPIILMGVLFGLAMDYEVFLVSRIREHYVHHGDPHQAIESGFVSASRVVVAAAIIMFGVFAAFVPEGSSVIKPIAFSLAVGVCPFSLNMAAFSIIVSAVCSRAVVSEISSVRDWQRIGLPRLTASDRVVAFGSAVVSHGYRMRPRVGQLYCRNRCVLAASH